MSRRLIWVLIALPATALLVNAGATPASAHAVQTFGGRYTIAIGWLHEPAYAGDLNAVQLLIKDSAGHPVSDLGSADLHVQVVSGGVTSTKFDFDPSLDEDTGLGTPGEYDAPLIPTVAGSYTFVLSASVHGVTIQQSYTSGPTTFATVTDATAVEVPTGVPSEAELATRISRDAQRLAAAQNDARDASAAAGRATILGIAGIAIGILLGGGALLAGRRRGGNSRA
jgi:hypothetical protein